MYKQPILDDDIFVIHEFLLPDECATLIATAEAAGFAEATINTLFGAAVRKQVRDNERVMIDQVPLAINARKMARPPTTDSPRAKLGSVRIRPPSRRLGIPPFATSAAPFSACYRSVALEYPGREAARVARKALVA